jgi:amino acid transporter
MAPDPTLQRQLSLFSLVMAVVTSTIGSGWLFAPYLSARLAGPASLLAWLAGGLMAFLIALVFAELGALISSSGALA